MEEKKVLTGRRLERSEALEQAIMAAALGSEDLSTDDQVQMHEALIRIVAAVQPKPRSTGPRVPLEKADPEVVKAWFEETGMTRKQLAAAAGVSTSVISTVQNPKGDRWSTETFSAKQELITTYMEEHADELEAARKADEAEAKAKVDKATAKEARKAKQAAAPTKSGAKTKPADITVGQSVTKAPKRRARKTATPQTTVQAVASN